MNLGDKKRAAMEGSEAAKLEIKEESGACVTEMLVDSKESESHGEKRPFDQTSDDAAKKAKKRRKVPGPVQPKNAVCQLNELKPGRTYSFVSQSGPVHAPVFVVSVEVDGQVFNGEGRSKKLAKQAAAEAALRSFVQFRNAADAHQAMGLQILDMDFTSDTADAAATLFNRRNSVHSQNGANAQNGSDPRLRSPGTPSQQGDKNPVMLLNELKSGLQYEMQSATGEAHAKRFAMSVTIDGQTFEGIGPSKRLAKAAAAKAALASLFNVNFSSSFSPQVCIPSPQHGGVPQVLADYVARLVMDKFNELTEGQPNNSRRIVLAGIVMTTGSLLKDASVVCVATGTKCINGEHMSVKGASINDCHAEIVARRCLLDFLYSQLELHLVPQTRNQSIFEPKLEGGGFCLREGVKFHLYINTAPCGDARIFSPHEMIGDMMDKHPNRKARGQLRTKIESGEGTIPVKSSDGIQTWDGVLQGQRLLTMSCSDKICRWNVLGLQGGLLSHMVQPIYLDSIILGSLFHPNHMSRAVGGRISGTIQGLPPPYRLNAPLMSLVSSPEVRQPSKAPNHSVNWTSGRTAAEVINAMTGKDEQNRASRLAKCSLFRRFLHLARFLPSRPPMQYSDAKNQAFAYQQAKEQLYDAFRRAELGAWLKKPIEQDQFELEEGLAE